MYCTACGYPPRRADEVLEICGLAAGRWPRSGRGRDGGRVKAPHRTAAATFLAEPRRARVITAKLIVYLLAGAACALACVTVSLAVALPWLAARGTPVSLAAHGNLAVLGAVIISVACSA